MATFDDFLAGTKINRHAFDVRGRKYFTQTGNNRMEAIMKGENADSRNGKYAAGCCLSITRHGSAICLFDRVY